MAKNISVIPDQDLWTVKSDAFDNAMVFRSGAKAEAAARGLGVRYARSGEPAQISVYLRDGTLAGRFVCPPVLQQGSSDEALSA